jgi:hypothetical protein
MRLPNKDFGAIIHVLFNKGASMQAAEIARAIIAGNFTNDDLNIITDAVRFARLQMTRKNTGSLVVGTNVKFTHPKTRKVHYGVVKKVKIKNITVLENGTVNWNVPANMLEIA